MTTSQPASYILIKDRKRNAFVKVLTGDSDPSDWVNSQPDPSNWTFIKLSAEQYWGLYLDENRWTVTYSSQTGKYSFTLKLSGATLKYFESTSMTLALLMQFRYWVTCYLKSRGVGRDNYVAQQRYFDLFRRDLLHKVLVFNSMPRLDKYPLPA